MKKIMTLVMLAILVNIVIADWDHAPTPINTNPFSPNVHYNSGHQRIIRIEDTILALEFRGESSETVWRKTDSDNQWTQIDNTVSAKSGALITGPDEYVYHFYRTGESIYMIKFKYDADPSDIPSPMVIYDANKEGSNGAYNMLTANVDSEGTLYVSAHWATIDEDDSLYVLKSEDDGDTWSGPYLIEQGDTDNCWGYVHLSVDEDDHIIAAYQQWGSARTMFAKSTDKGETWNSVDLSASFVVIYNPHILPAGDDYFIFAQSDQKDVDGLVFIKSEDAGQTWGDWTLIDETCGYADPGAGLGTDGETIFVAFRSSHGTGASGGCGDKSRSRLAVSRDLGETWTFPDDYYEGERTGTRNNVRYQTWWNYGGPLEWIWLQCLDSECDDIPTYYDVNYDEAIQAHPSGTSECSDDIDNDGDGQTDYPDDEGCISENDFDESNCGDEICESHESCSGCPEDCGDCPAYCGDEECNGDETCLTCEDDCGACPSVCGDENCDEDENCSICSTDCGACPFCGDGTCDDDENCSICILDCDACPPECAHDAESEPCDGVIDINELNIYILQWLEGEIEIYNLIEAIKVWKG